MADRLVQDHAAVKEVGKDLPGGDRALSDRHMEDESWIDQGAGLAGHRLGQRPVDRGGQRVATDGLVDGGLAGADSDGRCGVLDLVDGQIVEVGTGVMVLVDGGGIGHGDTLAATSGRRVVLSERAETPPLLLPGSHRKEVSDIGCDITNNDR